MLNSWPLYSQSCPGPARMLTTASASSCLWSGPHQFTASGGQDDVCNKVHAWHHTPEPSPPYPPGLLLRVLCPSVPQMYTLRSLAYRGNSRCYQAPNLSRPIQLPLPRSLPRLLHCRRTLPRAGPPTTLHTIVHHGACAGHYSRGSSNQGRGLTRWLTRAQLRADFHMNKWMNE